MSTNQSVSTTINPPTKTKITTLTLVIDPGTSCTKSVYLKGRRGKPKYSIASSVICPTAIVPRVEETYVKLPDDEQYYLVGDSAVQAKVQSSIRQLKSESLIPKTLGIIGQIAQDESLPNQFKLKLTLLLPMSEANDQEFVRFELSKTLEDFNYSGINYQVKESSIEFRPEGSGVYSYLSRTMSADTIKNQTCAYLMFGYRNTSLLLIENGKLNHRNSHSTDLGFYNYLDLVAEYSSGLYRHDIQKAIISKAFYGVGENCQQVVRGFTSQIRIEDLIRSTNAKYQERERAAISTAIERADGEYWQLLSRWLQEMLPPLNQLDHVIYCGGSTPFIETPIQQFFQDWNGELLNTDAMSIQMLEQLSLSPIAQSKFVEQYLPIRLADAWGEFVKLANIRV